MSKSKHSPGYLVAVCLPSGGGMPAAWWQSGCHMGATWLECDWRLDAAGLGSRCSLGAVLTPTGYPPPQLVPLATCKLTTDILVLPEQCSNGTLPPKNGSILRPCFWSILWFQKLLCGPPCFLRTCPCRSAIGTLSPACLVTRTPRKTW